MNFVENIDSLLDGEMTNQEKVIAICDLLIPKIMYTPLKDADSIINKLYRFQQTTNHEINEQLLLQITRAFLTYRLARYQDAISIINDFDEKQLKSTNEATQACRFVVLGACCRSLGQKENALSAFHVALELFFTAPSSPHQYYLYILSFYHIAEINSEMKNYEVMLEKHHQFYKIATTVDNIDMINRALNGIGRAYMGLEDFENGMEYLKKAEESSAKAANIPFLARNLHDIGEAYGKMKNYEKSLAYFHQALKIREAQQLTNASISTYIAIGTVYTAQSNFNKAIEVLNKARAMAEERKISAKLYKIYEQLSCVYEKNKQYESALEFYKKFHATKAILDDVNSAQIENERVREINTQLYKQKNIINKQKLQIEANVNKLMETNKYLQNFASVAAHDLKAPIRLAGSFTGLLERKYQQQWDDTDKQYLDFISSNVNKLAKMIDDLLSLSRLDQDLPPTELVDINTLLLEVKNRIKNKILESKAVLTIQDDLPDVIAHESLVGQLFQNLIDNALKYRSDAIPKVQVTAIDLTDSNGKEYVQFEIKDNGLGISDYLQGRMFELFSGTKSQNSNGIGLATCKKIVTNYGGDIWVSSKEGEGTSMFFTLPKGTEVVTCSLKLQ